MAKLSFSDIDDAFFFVSSNTYGMNSAILRKDTGRIFYQSEMEEMYPDPEEVNWDDAIAVCLTKTISGLANNWCSNS